MLFPRIKSRWVGLPWVVAAVTILLVSTRAEVTDGEFGAGRKSGKSSSRLRPEVSVPAKKETSGKRYPFHGKVESADAASGTITLKGKVKNRVIVVTADTYITRDGRSAKLGDAKAGEAVSGSVTKVEGKERALTLRLKGEGDAAARKESAVR